MEQRRTKRFSLHLPLSITRAGAEPFSINATTNNISSTGILFTADRKPDVGGAIEYVVTLSPATQNPVSIRCVGKVVRAETVPVAASAERYKVAATLERYEFVR